MYSHVPLNRFKTKRNKILAKNDKHALHITTERVETGAGATLQSSDKSPRHPVLGDVTLAERGW